VPPVPEVVREVKVLRPQQFLHRRCRYGPEIHPAAVGLTRPLEYACRVVGSRFGGVCRARVASSAARSSGVITTHCPACRSARRTIWVARVNQGSRILPCVREAPLLEPRSKGRGPERTGALKPAFRSERRAGTEPVDRVRSQRLRAVEVESSRERRGSSRAPISKVLTNYDRQSTPSRCNLEYWRLFPVRLRSIVRRTRRLGEL
jgi:hypothetical protein